MHNYLMYLIMKGTSLLGSHCGFAEQHRIDGLKSLQEQHLRVKASTACYMYVYLSHL